MTILLNIYRSAVLLIIFLVICYTTTATAQISSVTISTGEWAPYTSEKLDQYGVSLHIVTAAFSKVGVQAKYQFYPWARAMKEVEDGNADFSGIWFFTKERAEKFVYTEEVISSNNAFFYRKDLPFDWTSLQSFPQQTIGITRSYSYSEQFDEAVKAGEIQVEVASSDILNFRKLLRGRIAAFPISELVGYDLLKQEFNAFERVMLEVHQKKISSDALHLIVSKNNPNSAELIDTFNQGLAELKRSGDLQKILNQYR